MCACATESVLPPGRYYIGDLTKICTRDEWLEIIECSGDEDTHITDVCMETSGGVRFYMFDLGENGLYYDQDNRTYGIETNHIGCVNVRTLQNASVKGIKHGNIIEFKQAFTCKQVGNVLHFGKDVRICLDSS
jgi:hypothetical protein